MAKKKVKKKKIKVEVVEEAPSPIIMYFNPTDGRGEGDFCEDYMIPGAAVELLALNGRREDGTHYYLRTLSKVRFVGQKKIDLVASEFLVKKMSKK